MLVETGEEPAGSEERHHFRFGTAAERQAWLDGCMAGRLTERTRGVRMGAGDTDVVESGSEGAGDALSS